MLYNNPMIKIKTIRYLFEAILGINLLIITRILGLKLSSKIFSWVFSNLGPKLNISNQAKENLLIAFPNIKDSEINTIIFKMWKNIGMVAAEFFHLRKISRERNIRIQVIGEEYINKYKNNVRITNNFLFGITIIYVILYLFILLLPFIKKIKIYNTSFFIISVLKCILLYKNLIII